MTDWSLTELFNSLHRKIDEELSIARKAIQHPSTKGNTSEGVWIGLLETYLPKRYQVCTGHVVDSEGEFSDQIDIIIFDRQYSPFIFDFLGAKVVPAESVYGVFEAKQSINAEQIGYAREKVQSVRKLERTSLPVPSVDTTEPPKELKPILGGVLAFDSDWSPALGDALLKSLTDELSDNDMLDIGCVSSAGVVLFNSDNATYEIRNSKSATTLFLLELIKQLRLKATVPVIDVDAYARWLE